MKTRTRFRTPYRPLGRPGENIIEHLAGVEDFEGALAGEAITLRQGARIIKDSRDLQKS